MKNEKECRRYISKALDEISKAMAICPQTAHLFEFGDALEQLEKVSELLAEMEQSDWE